MLFDVRPLDDAVTAPPATLSEVEAFSEPTVEEPTIAFAIAAVLVAVSVPTLADPTVAFAEVSVSETFVDDALSMVAFVIARLLVEVAVSEPTVAL